MSLKEIIEEGKELNKNHINNLRAHASKYSMEFDLNEKAEEYEKAINEAFGGSYL